MTDPIKPPRGENQDSLLRRGKPTLRTIANLTGLAVTTVSRALSDAPQISLETRERVHKIAREPEHTEPEEDAHERRQMGNGLEGRNRQQYAEPEAEHQVAFEGAALTVGGVWIDCGRDYGAPAQKPGNDQQRHRNRRSEL